MTTELRALGAAATLAALAGLATAQSDIQARRVAATAQPQVTFASIHRAMTTGSYEIDQERRLLTEDRRDETWVTIREKLTLRPDGPNATPEFALEFRGVDGAHLSPNQRESIHRVYDNNAAYLHRVSPFAIENPQTASRNYKLLPLDGTMRAGRPAQRVAILPNDPWRSAWLLEVDAETSYPLYQAEYRFDGQPVASIEITRFEVGIATESQEWWRPRLDVDHFDSVADAIDSLPHKPRFVLPHRRDLPSGYRLQSVRTVTDPNALQAPTSLTLIYGDGIDEISVVQTPKAPAPSIPVARPGSSDIPYAVFTYKDMNVSQFMFHIGDARVQVLGRSTQPRLEHLTTALLRKALQ